jgi:hypothetical protein
VSTTAKALLDIMKVRLSMLEQGTIEPSSAVAAATRQLVERLAALPNDEAIQIEYTREPLHAKYIRMSTNEVLAELGQQSDA